MRETSSTKGLRDRRAAADWPRGQLLPACYQPPPARPGASCLGPRRTTCDSGQKKRGGSGAASFKREKLPTIAVCRFVKLRIEAFGDKPTTEQVTSTSGSFVHALPGPLFRSGVHSPIEQRPCHVRDKHRAP